MQNDLFKQLDLMDNNVIKQSARLTEQIKTRSFKIKNEYRSLEMVDDYFKGEESSDVKAYIKELLHCNRDYYSNTINADNLFDLEALGVAYNAKRYTVIIDFENALDYVMHSAFSCPVSSIRKLENYDMYSKAILNMNFDSVNGLLLGDLLHSNDLVLQNLNELYIDAMNRGLGFEDAVVQVASSFCMKILDKLNNLMCRTAVALKYDLNGVFRSYSLSKAIVSSEIPFSGELLLECGTLESYKVVARSYRPFEYLKEESFYESFRRNYHQ